MQAILWRHYLEQARTVLEHAAKSLASPQVVWVRVLFDQGTPVPLRNFLNPHQIETVFERGWSMLTNGALLTQTEEAGFDVFVTTDKNLRHQQNLSTRRIAIVVLSSTSWPRIQRAVVFIKEVIETTLPGSLNQVSIP